jgi:hypothetical protein
VNSGENGDEEMGPVRDEYVEECRGLSLVVEAGDDLVGVLFRVREIDDFTTVPRSRPG